MARLENKVAVVTGAGSGLGYSITKRFIEEGAKVVAVDLNESVHTTLANVSKEDDVKSMIEAGIKAFDKIDILINNAGIGGPQKKLHEVSSEEFQQTLDVNLLGPFYGIKHIVPHFIENGGGSVVNTASLAAYSKYLSAAPYSVTKAGVKKITEIAAYEYANDNVRINAVAPGSIATPIFDDLPDLKAELETKMLTGRLGEPEEIANVVLFLASDEASFVNGQTYIADGGQILT